MLNFKYLTLITIAIMGVAWASGLRKVEMTSTQIHTILTKINRNDLEADAWVINGNEAWTQDSTCPVKRKITIYAKPKIYEQDLATATAVVFTFESMHHNRFGHCDELIKPNETKLIVAEFGKDEPSKTIRDYFQVRGGVTASELISIRDILNSVTICLNGGDCNSLSIRNAFSDDNARLRAVTIKNIACIEKLPPSRGGSTYMILFRSYPADKLAVFISDIYSKTHRVDISAVIP